MVLHLVPPLVVVIAAEAVADLQHALTQCGHQAHHRPPRPAVNPSEPVTRAAVNGEAPDLLKPATPPL
ncbi:MAG TPA: hypothetical protein VGL46_27660 [Pseudonocardiaceae bacterium]